MPRTDPELVDAALEGDVQAFREIVERYQGLVFRIIYHYIGRRNEVEDLAQEVFLKLYRSLPRFDKGRPLQAWISKITGNHCVDAIRKAKSRPVKSFSDLSEAEMERIEFFTERAVQNSGLTEQEAEESFALLHRLMEDLGEKERLAFVLREIEGVSYAEMSRMLRTSEMAVRIRVSRARKKLQARFAASLAAGKERGR
jgi:RNA polymerase sigma-70 factor, ECF subfamily